MFLSFKEKDKAIVIVTHDLNKIKEYCDHALVLNNGKIGAIGEPQVVINYYKNSMM